MLWFGQTARGLPTSDAAARLHGTRTVPRYGLEVFVKKSPPPFGGWLSAFCEG